MRLLRRSAWIIFASAALAAPALAATPERPGADRSPLIQGDLS